VQRSSGSTGPVHVVSAYRSSRTNEMLRRRSRGVAKNSQHTAGRALDFNLPDVSMAHVRDIGLKLQRGGVGYYPRANNPWVHLDTGGVRHWPKVTRDHLVRLFPDGRTVHIPRDGKPLEGFEAARQIIEARGGSVSSGYIDIAEGRATGRTLFQILFGGGEADDEGDIVPAGRRGGRTAVAQRGSARGAAQPAAPAPTGDDAGSALAFMQTGGGAQQPAAGAIRPRPARPVLTAEPVVDTQAEERKRQEELRRIEVAALREAEQKAASDRAAQEKATQEAALKARREAEEKARREAEDDEGTRVTVALPPRRPGNLQAEAAVAALANVPLPPSRPRTLLADNGLPERALETGSVSGRDTAPQPIRTAGLPEATRGMAAPLAFAPAPPRPPLPEPGRVVPAAPRPQPVETGVDRKGMNELLSRIAASRSETTARAVAPSVKAIVENRSLTGRFEATPARTETASFSGSAIRPLGNGFRRTAE
jgi:hypothetical protein